MTDLEVHDRSPRNATPVERDRYIYTGGLVLCMKCARENHARLEVGPPTERPCQDCGAGGKGQLRLC